MNRFYIEQNNGKVNICDNESGEVIIKSVDIIGAYDDLVRLNSSSLSKNIDNDISAIKEKYKKNYIKTNNLQKLQIAKQQYDELEAIRIKASNIMVNKKYEVCVHLHYKNKISISLCKNSIWAQFDLIDGEVNVTNRGNYNDAEIENMLVFIENWLGE